jgi:predicted O-linked N-acetylglucosamine transferase (SPINDLY family)
MSFRPGRPAPAPSGDRSATLLQTAVAHQQAGRLNEAAALYRQILAATPSHFDAKHLLGVVALQSGRLDEAGALIGEAVALNPKVAAAHNNLGNVYLRQGRHDEAQASFRRAVQLDAKLADANFNLATQLRRQGKLDEAATHFKRAVAANGKSYDAHTGLAATLLDLGDARGAVRALETAVKLKPGQAEAQSNLGLALSRTGEHAAALEALDRAQKLDPKSTNVLRNRGTVLARMSRYAEARQCLESLVALEPQSAAAHCNLGNVLRDSGVPAEALERYRKAVALDPNLVEARIGEALTLRDLGRDDEARDAGRELLEDQPESAAVLIYEGERCLERDDTKGAAAAFRRAIELQGSNPDAYGQLGNVLMRQLKASEAIACYQRVLALDPSNALARWTLTMAQIPPLAADAGEVPKSRANFTRMLGELDRWFDPTRSADGYRAVGTMQPFYLAYQELDNRDLLARYGSLCARLMASWQKSHVATPAPRHPGGPIRVGIASAQLRDHSVWNAIVKGWVKHLDKKRFELHLFNLGARSDAETEQAREWAHRLETQRLGLTQWASMIAASELDVLLYPEIGMDPLTVKLANLRLAPVQAATWGHPETTGLPTIDYFLSAEALEPPKAEAHYTEKLVSLPNLGVVYEPLAPMVVAPDLGALGLPPNVPLLLCPGAPFKYSPLHDKVWIEISRRAAPCRLVFFRAADPEVSPLFEQRLERRYRQAGLRFDDCATFVPTLDRARFFGLMRRAHLMLDTLGFSGFNTVIQAIESGLPVVSREGQFLRGRLGSGILRHMKMDALVATTDDAYVELAVDLVRDGARLAVLREEMIARRPVLFGDRAPVQALERFIESAVQTATGTAPR